MSYGKCMFNFCETLPNCFTMWLYHFVFTTAVYESSTCFTSLPILVSLLVLAILEDVNYDLVILMCISPKTVDAECLFTCL